jgi:hypothetical protein
MVFDGRYTGQIGNPQKHLIFGCGLDATQSHRSQGKIKPIALQQFDGFWILEEFRPGNPIHFGLKIMSRVETYLFSAMLILIGMVIVLTLPNIEIPLVLETHWRDTLSIYVIGMCYGMMKILS